MDVHSKLISVTNYIIFFKKIINLNFNLQYFLQLLKITIQLIPLFQRGEFLRNIIGLNSTQIKHVTLAWEFLMSVDLTSHLKLKTPMQSIVLDISDASVDNSRTTFNEKTNTIKIGADVYPNTNALDANSRMDYLTCLCHEYAHAQRLSMGFDRPTKTPESHLDEAETSIHASFIPCLHKNGRKDLIEDAELRLMAWKREIECI